MSKFTDFIIISTEAGRGGAGAVSFLREKYLPKGGPDGGDGGKGGDIILTANPSFVNLSHLFKDRVYKAENGKSGMGKNKHGSDGKNLVINVPFGTEVFDDVTGEKIGDLLEAGETLRIAQGGIGGKGNAFFKSSTNQAPRISQPGIVGERRTVSLNLKLIADVGLVGLPNAGKSTLLSALTNARPKIADYPFTTLTPNLGVVEKEDGFFYKIADIPGIIEGAHKGQGLGLSFLRHIERVKIILYLIDLTEDDPLYTLKLLRSELKTYNEVLINKPCYIVLSKADLVIEEEIQKKVDLIDDKNILAISSASGYNIANLLDILDNLIRW